MMCRRCGTALNAERAETLLHLDIAWWDLCLACAEAEHGKPADEVNTTPEAFTRHINAAHGFLELADLKGGEDMPLSAAYRR